jgi:putative DNA primase/helicase
MRATPSCRAAAHVCARSYLAVFPVWWPVNGVCQCPASRRCESPGKHPLLRAWQDAATITPAVIDRWWDRWPDANIGLACGPSGILVLDIDPRHGGEETDAELIATHGPLPHTVETLTGSGGRHILLAAPAGITNASPFAGIDVRGDGGFIVAPGSLHVSGRRYEWEASSHPDDVPVAPAPAWLLQRLSAPQEAQHTRAAAVPERIPEGGRHAAMVSIAGTLRHRGATPDEIFACLLVFNRSRCEPLLDDAELRRIADSMVQYGVGETPVGGVAQRRRTVAASGRYSLREGR